MKTMILALLCLATAANAQELLRSTISSGSRAWSTPQLHVRGMLGTRTTRVTLGPTSDVVDTPNARVGTISCSPMPASETVMLQFAAASLLPYTVTAVTTDGRQYELHAGMTDATLQTRVTLSLQDIPSGQYLFVVNCAQSRSAASLIIQH
jgi:hypothetical protein